MRILLPLLLCLLAHEARADGVALFSPGPALAASDVARISAKRPTKSAALAIVNKNAVDSTVITATLDGKTYRFVGTKQTIKGVTGVQMTSGTPTLITEDGGERWVGTTAAGDRLSIGRSAFGLFGRFNLADGRRFWLVKDGGQFVITELAQHSAKAGSYDEPTPQMIDAMRKRDAERAKVIGGKT